jgi:hypothetical protein
MINEWRRMNNDLRIANCHFAFCLFHFSTQSLNTKI